LETLNNIAIINKIKVNLELPITRGFGIVIRDREKLFVELFSIFTIFRSFAAAVGTKIVTMISLYVCSE
jgi:hypothetical protein